MNSAQKLLIIGFNGATWDVLIPLIKERRLLTFVELTRNATYGALEIVIPPVTGGA